MGNRLDLSWDTIPCDGASAPVAPSLVAGPADYDNLFQAWCRERHENIETRLFLDEAVRILRHLLAEGKVSGESRKCARRLLSAIRDSAERSEEDSA
jgi:hypothetical protein